MLVNEELFDEDNRCGIYAFSYFSAVEKFKNTRFCHHYYHRSLLEHASSLHIKQLNKTDRLFL